MARIRTIKPEFFRHEGLYDLERETGLPIRVAFAGLWTAADREGRFEWRPRQLKLDCLPHDECDFSRVLDALATRGFIVKYASNGSEYGYIPSWSYHQVINNRETASVLPIPPNQEESTTSTREPRVPDACATRHELCKGEGEGEGELDTTPATVTRTSVSKRPPTAGVVLEGQPNPPKPEAPAPGLDALRTGPPVGTADHDAAGELWGCLAANGCKGTAQHPAVVEMARSGVTVAQLKAAIAEARKTREGQLNPAYLAAIVERMRAERPRDPTAIAWATNDSACDAKARELGLAPRAGESYAELRGRIRDHIAETARESVH